MHKSVGRGMLFKLRHFSAGGMVRWRTGEGGGFLEVEAGLGREGPALALPSPPSSSALTAALQGCFQRFFFFFPSPKVFGCEDCDSFVVGFFSSSLNRGSCQDIKEHKLIKGALVKQRTTEGHHATVSTANLLWISLQAVSYGFRQYICLFLQTHAALCSVLPTYCGKLYTVPCY